MPLMTRRAAVHVAAALSLAFAALPAAQAQPKTGGELKIALSYDPSALDPHFSAIAGNDSNKRLDDAVQASLASTDPAKRDEHVREAMAVAVKDFAVLPSHYQLASWAMKKSLAYAGRIAEFTFAQQVKPQ